MSAVLGFDVRDVRIAQQLLARLRQHPNEGIVLRVQNQRRNRDAVEARRGRRARVVILGVEEAAITRRDLIVEVAQAAQAAQIAQVVNARDRAPPCAACGAAGPRETSFRRCGSRGRAGRRQKAPGPWRAKPIPAMTCGGTCSPHSPSSFSTRLPPMEKPANASFCRPSSAISALATAPTSADMLEL